MTMRRGLGLALALLALATTACRPDPAPAAGATLRPAPGVAGARRVSAPVSLTFVGDSLGLGNAFDRALAERFERDTGIHVRVVPRPQSANAMYAELARLFKAGGDPPDVVVLDVVWPGAFADDLLDLGPALGTAARAALPELVSNDTVAGRLVAVPWFVDVGLLFYRRDLLSRHGYDQPPATWDALEAMASKVVAGERAHDKNFTGYVWQGAAYEGLTCNALEWQVSHGADGLFHSETGALNVDGPLALAAFARAARWVGGISPKAVTGYLEEDARRVFQGGHALFMRNWPYAIAMGNAPGSPVAGRFEVAPLPHAAGAEAGAATLGGWQLGVPRRAKHPQEAISFIRYLTSPEVQAWRAREGTYLPTIRALYADPALIARRPFFAVMPAVLDQAVTRPSNRTKGRYAAVSARYAAGVHAIIEGAEPARAATAMRRAIEALIE